MMDQLKKTTTQQKKQNDDRFKNADTTLLKEQDSSPKKPAEKLIRDGFLLPGNEHGIIGVTRDRLSSMSCNASKTEVIRIALNNLEHMTDKQLTNAYKELKPIKKGRPC